MHYSIENRNKNKNINKKHRHKYFREVLRQRRIKRSRGNGRKEENKIEIIDNGEKNNDEFHSANFVQIAIYRNEFLESVCKNR